MVMVLWWWCRGGGSGCVNGRGDGVGGGVVCCV